MHKNKIKIVWNIAKLMYRSWGCLHPIEGDLTNTLLEKAKNNRMYTKNQPPE